MVITEFKPNVVCLLVLYFYCKMHTQTCMHVLEHHPLLFLNRKKKCILCGPGGSLYICVKMLC